MDLQGYAVVVVVAHLAVDQDYRILVPSQVAERSAAVLEVVVRVEEVVAHNHEAYIVVVVAVEAAATDDRIA